MKRCVNHWLSENPVKVCFVDLFTVTPNQMHCTLRQKFLPLSRFLLIGALLQQTWFQTTWLSVQALNSAPAEQVMPEDCCCQCPIVAVATPCVPHCEAWASVDQLSVCQSGLTMALLLRPGTLLLPYPIGLAGLQSSSGCWVSKRWDPCCVKGRRSSKKIVAGKVPR